jgi:hypothetical protein
MPELALRCEPVEIHQCCLVGPEDGAIEISRASEGDDVRYFLLSVTGSDLLAHGEMVLK